LHPIEQQGRLKELDEYLVARRTLSELYAYKDKADPRVCGGNIQKKIASPTEFENNQRKKAQIDRPGGATTNIPSYSSQHGESAMAGKPEGLPGSQAEQSSLTNKLTDPAD